MDYSIALHPDVVGDVSHLPFADETFDSLLCTEVLEHVPELKFAINEMFRALRKGGKGYIAVLMMWYLHYEPHDYYRYTKYGISYLFREGGFEIIVIEKNGGLVQFLTSRMAEELFIWFHRACFPLRFNPHSRERVALVLFAPLSFSLWVLTEFLDNVSKRDVLDWSMLVRKPIEFFH